MINLVKVNPITHNKLLVKSFFSAFGIGVDDETARRYLDVLSEMGKVQESEEWFVEEIANTESLVCSTNEVPISSFCKHHLLPWFGFAEFYYKPNGKVLGISKFKRMVDHFSMGLSMQEEVTILLHRTLVELLGCRVRVKIRATHSCAIVRGVKLDPNFEFLTVAGTTLD